MAASNKSTMVPVTGNRNFVNALSTVARARNTTMAQLVRAALDSLYGSEIERAAIFFEQNGTLNHQSDSKITTEADHVPTA